MKVATRPLVRIDAGWLFVIGGLAMLVALVILPGRRSVHDMREQLRVLKDQESFALARLNAYEEFLRALRQGDEQIIRRLAASHLNLVPEGETAIMLASSLDHTVPDWIDDTLDVAPSLATPYPDTLLIRLAEGRNRLWLLCGSVLVIFFGLIMGPEFETRPRRGRRAGEALDGPAVDAATAMAAGAVGAAGAAVATMEGEEADQGTAVATYGEWSEDAGPPTGSDVSLDGAWADDVDGGPGESAVAEDMEEGAEEVEGEGQIEIDDELDEEVGVEDVIEDDVEDEDQVGDEVGDDDLDETNGVGDGVGDGVEDGDDAEVEAHAQVASDVDAEDLADADLVESDDEIELAVEAERTEGGEVGAVPDAVMEADGAGSSPAAVGPGVEARLVIPPAFPLSPPPLPIDAREQAAMAVAAPLDGDPSGARLGGAIGADAVEEDQNTDVEDGETDVEDEAEEGDAVAEDLVEEAEEDAVEEDLIEQDEAIVEEDEAEADEAEEDEAEEDEAEEDAVDEDLLEEDAIDEVEEVVVEEAAIGAIQIEEDLDEEDGVDEDEDEDVDDLADDDLDAGGPTLDASSADPSEADDVVSVLDALSEPADFDEGDVLDDIDVLDKRGDLDADESDEPDEDPDDEVAVDLLDESDAGSDLDAGAEADDRPSRGGPR